MIIIYRLLIILALIFLTSCINHNNFQEGVASFCRENYRQAFIRLKTEALKGQRDAQYAVGYMYYYGKGVIENRKKAWIWMNRAASRGQIQAKEALKILEKQNNKY